MSSRARWVVVAAVVVLALLAVLSRVGEDVRLDELRTTCRLADRLRVTGQPEEAAALYRQVLASPEARPPAGPGPDERREQGCALDGLRAIDGASLPAAPLPQDTPELGRPGFLDLAQDGARRVLRSAWGWFAGQPVEVRAAEWALVALLAIAAAVVVAGRRRRCRLGWLDVGTFVTATDDRHLAIELAARITDDLTRLGVPPAAAPPSGTVGTTALEVLGTSPVPQAAWLGKVGAYLSRIVAPPPTAATLTGTVREHELTVELNVDGQAPVVRTFPGPHPEAARSAAGFAYVQFVREHDRCCAPSWARWTCLDGSSVAHYFTGLELEEDGKRLEALDEYWRAAWAEPEQLEIRLRIASLMELLERWPEALRVYHDEVAWMESRGQPPVFAPAYRFAITLSFAFSLVNPLRADARLVADLRAQGIVLPKDGDRDEWIRALRTGAVGQMEALYGGLSLGRAVRDWLGTFSADGGQYGRRRELAELARPWGRLRRLRRNVVAMALICVNLERQGQAAAGSSRAIEAEIRRLLKRHRAKNWQLRYNAACCYSRLLARESEETARGRLYCEAMKQLDAAYREAGGDLDLDWVERDPDLQALRREPPPERAKPTFAAWAGRRRPPRPTPARSAAKSAAKRSVAKRTAKRARPDGRSGG